MLAALRRESGGAPNAAEPSEALLKRLGVPEGRRRSVALLYREAVAGTAAFEDHAREFYRRFRYRPALLRAGLDLLVEGALSEGGFSGTRAALVSRAADIFGFRGLGYRRILARHNIMLDTGESERGAPSGRRAGGSAYDILGLDPAASVPKIKAAYRKLAKESHPDRLLAQGLPQEFYDEAQALHPDSKGIRADPRGPGILRLYGRSPNRLRQRR